MVRKKTKNKKQKKLNNIHFYSGNVFIIQFFGEIVHAVHANTASVHWSVYLTLDLLKCESLELIKPV